MDLLQTQLAEQPSSSYVEPLLFNLVRLELLIPEPRTPADYSGLPPDYNVRAAKRFLLTTQGDYTPADRQFGGRWFEAWLPQAFLIISRSVYDTVFPIPCNEIVSMAACLESFASPINNVYNAERGWGGDV